MMLTTRTSQWIAQDRYALFSFLIILIYLAMALFSAMGWVASDFSMTDLDLSYQSPSWSHWLGTDFLGRDVLSRAIHGSQIALQIGFFSASLATLIGLTLGSLGGFYGGRVDAFVVWVYTTFSSIPSILLLSAFAFVLGQGLENLYIALGLTSWVKLCRLVRAEFLKNKSLDYVQAAKALGATSFSQMFKHILPNVLHLASVQFNLTFIMAIKYEVILSYLGLGVEPGTPSWGLMISDAQLELSRGVWWNLLAATGFMFILILAVNLMTESIEKSRSPQS